MRDNSMIAKVPKPPRFAKWLLSRMTKYQENHSITGDVEEVFYVIAKEDGAFKAYLWYWYQSLVSFLLYFLYISKWRMVMLQSYLKIAFRTYFRNKVITVVNLYGLALGMAAFIIIVLYVSYETSFDKFHPNSQNIYRIQYKNYRNGELIINQASAVPAIAHVLKDNFSEVTAYARATRQFLEYAAFTYNEDITFRENRIFVATPSFLTMFNFPLINGDPETALSGPLRAVMTESTAKRYFGNEDPLGKIITYNSKHDFEVTGVCQDIPVNSHFKFDVLLSYLSLSYTAHIDPSGEEAETDWNWGGFYTYVALKPGADPLSLQERLNQRVAEVRGGEWKKNSIRQEFLLQPLEDIHLYSSLTGEVIPNEQGNEEAIKVLKVIAAFILILAWVNYINISTSRAMERAREVGIRKISGAIRKELTRQFFLEYIGIILVALFLSILIVISVNPYLFGLTGAHLSLESFFQSDFWVKLTVLFVSGTLMVGFYPAAVMSAFKPATILKGKLTRSIPGVRMRKFLVTLQLAVSVALIAGTFIVFQQMSFMLNKDLGIDMEQTLVAHAPGMNEAPPPVWSNNLDAFRQDIAKYPLVSNVTTATSVPGQNIFWGHYFRKQEDDPRLALSMKMVGIDDNFIPSFGIKLVAGRNFSQSIKSDEQAMILNESAVKELGYANPEKAINRKVIMRRREWMVIGVMGDYNHHSLKVRPFPIVYLQSGNRGFVAVKLVMENLDKTIALLKDKWKQYFPGIPFDYFFLDESFNRNYRSEQIFRRVFTLFTGLTVLIACMGLFALASLNAVQRTKEIGIRKAMGASASAIYSLLSKEFLRLVLFASVFAIPLTYFQMNKWLGNFAYRIRIEWWFFAASWALVSAVVLLTVSLQTLRAAGANPVNALRYE